MATIALYAGKIREMPGLLNQVKASVNDYKDKLFDLRGKALSVNGSVCRMDDVVSSLQASAQTQERKAASLDSIRQGMEAFASDAAAIDGEAAERVRRRKEDFYKQYAWLKPDCERSGWERLRDGLKSAGAWCREHWKLVVTVVAVVAAIMLCVFVPASIPFVLAIVKGALTGALTGGLMGGVVNLLLGESFWKGFWDGAFWGGVFGGFGGAGRAFAGCRQVIQALGGVKKVSRVIAVVAKVSGTLSLAMGGFDIAALAVRLFDPSHPLAVFNQRLHSSWLYNGFQFVVGAVAAFSAGAHLQMRRNPRVCFVAGTLILTAARLRAIESIRAGDRVLATDPESGVTEEKAVVETYVRETGQLVHLRVGGELISTTPNHPFWVKGRGFVSAGELQAGEELVNAAGEVCRVENIRREIVERPEKVYNFQVEGFHTYHVGSIGVLVHNTDCGGEGGSEHRYSVDSSMLPDDEAAGVLRNGEYVKNPTAHNINDYISEGSNYLGSKNMNGQYMYVVDMDGNIIIGTRGGQRMPHPTLVGGSNPQVQAAGIIEIRGGKIYSINNASGHFKPSIESLKIAEDVFNNLSQNIFSKDFQGYLSFGE